MAVLYIICKYFSSVSFASFPDQCKQLTQITHSNRCLHTILNVSFSSHVIPSFSNGCVLCFFYVSCNVHCHYECIPQRGTSFLIRFNFDQCKCSNHQVLNCNPRKYVIWKVPNSFDPNMSHESWRKCILSKSINFHTNFFVASQIIQHEPREPWHEFVPAVHPTSTFVPV